MARPFDLLGVCEKKGTLTERGGAASRCGQYYGQLPEETANGEKKWTIGLTGGDVVWSRSGQSGQARQAKVRLVGDGQAGAG